MTDDREREAALARGAALFNAERFFEAHEAWEDGWRGSRGEPALLLQALIQAAAAFVKEERNAPRGMLLLLDKAIEKLETIGADAAPFEIDPFIATLREWRAVAREAVETGLPLRGRVPAGTRRPARPCVVLRARRG